MPAAGCIESVVRKLQGREMPVLSSILFSLGPAPVGRPLLSSGVGLPSSGKCFGNSLKDIPGSMYPEQFLIQVDDED